MKSILPAFIFISMPFLAAAQSAPAGQGSEASPASPFPVFLEDPLFYFWVLLAAVLLMVVFALVHSIRVLSKAVLAKTVAGEVSVTEAVKTKSAYQKLMEALTRSVPVEQERDVLLDHDYDGIRELDNKLPPWWIWGFYVTIVFAFVYVFYYHFSGSGKLMVAEYQEELSQAALENEERIRMKTDFVTAENVVRLTDQAALSEGAVIFQKNCLACHGDKGQGNVGPNVTDAYWLHGGGIKNIFHTINEGVPSKGMISWKTQLSPKQIQQVSSYIMNLQGTNPAGAKDPQGELYAEPADSTGFTSGPADTLKTGSKATAM